MRRFTRYSPDSRRMVVQRFARSSRPIDFSFEYSPYGSGMKIPNDWLTQRVENAPMAQHRNLSPMAAMRIRMAWQKLKSEAGAGDELWAFENPSNTWKKLGRHSGYALVRNGKIVKSAVVTSE